jgi:CRP-like cAMP-binding protein
MRATPSARPWVSSEFARKFAGRLALAPEELPILDEIFTAARPIPRRQDIVVEGRPTRSIFFVIDGLLIRYRITRDGQRQVLNVFVPGDVAGYPSCFFDCALYSVRTMTTSVVAAVSLNALSALLDEQPRFAAKLFWLFSFDSAVCAEHLVVVGRRSARQRIAHFFLELLTRFQAIGLADETSYNLPFSQDVIGDSLGLSLAYVNRELRSLASDGLVIIDDHKVMIKDSAALAEFADFERRYLNPLPAHELFARMPPTWKSTKHSERLGTRSYHAAT